MADIKQIEVDGITYNLKDEAAREALEGKQDAITAVVSPTVTEDGGDPSASVQFENGQMNFAFSNLKGDTGETGPKGPQGDSVLVGQGDLPLAHTLGNDNTKAMSQKGVTDAVNEYTDQSRRDLMSLLAVDFANSIRKSDKFGVASPHHYAIPVEEGDVIEITAPSGSSLTYYWLEYNKVPNGAYVHGFVDVTYEDGHDYGTVAAGATSRLTAPVGAFYLYFDKPDDLLPQSLYIIKKQRDVLEDLADCIEVPVKYRVASYNISRYESNWSHSEYQHGYVIVNPGDRFVVNPKGNFVYTWLKNHKYGSGITAPKCDSCGYLDVIPANSQNIIIAPSDARTLVFTDRTTGESISFNKFSKLKPKNEQKEISVLFFGNSLTQDAVSCLPLLMKELAPDVKFRFYIYYNGGRNLQEQYGLLTNLTKPSIFSICENGESWENNNSWLTPIEIIGSFQFDVLCLQEFFSVKENDVYVPRTTYNETDAEYANLIIEWIRARYAHPFKAVTLLPAPLRSDVVKSHNLAKRGMGILLRNTSIDSLIPAGEALYQALYTSLDALGDLGHLSPDGLHAQEGLPCLLQAYTVALWIFNQLGISKGVTGSTTRITNDVYTALNVPGPNIGTGVVTGSEADNALAQKIATNAMSKEIDILTTQNDVIPVTWESGHYLNAGGESVLRNLYMVSDFIPVNSLKGKIWRHHEAYSVYVDMRSFALYSSNEESSFVAASKPSTYLFGIAKAEILDFDKVIADNPTANYIRLCHSERTDIYHCEIMDKEGKVGEIANLSYELKYVPSSTMIDNFSFSSAEECIPVLSNIDEDATSLDNKRISLGQIVFINGYYYYFYHGWGTNEQTIKDGNAHLLVAHSLDGRTWTRGYPSGVTPPVSGDNYRLMPDMSLQECCWCRVPDPEYPWRMIGNIVGSTPGNKHCHMWKSQDGFHYVDMGRVLGGHNDTQYAAVVRGNIIKLYMRKWESEDYATRKIRRVGLAYLTMDGKCITPPHAALGDYLYEGAASAIDDRRELVLSTYFNNLHDGNPKGQDMHLRAYLAEGEKFQLLDSNINECLSDDTLWAYFSPGIVSLNSVDGTTFEQEQYMLLTEGNKYHDTPASNADVWKTKLVKIIRS
jgi:hypothetical protein